jgi:peptide/nickel transport system substrate-binding protein
MVDAKMTSGPARHLYDAYISGALDRRSFVQRATALGLSMSMVALMAQRGAAQGAGDYATPAAGASPDVDDLFVTNGAPSEAGTENQTRGEGGDLRIIQWQAPTLLSPHVSTGYKDYDAAQIVMEPLLRYLPDSQLYGNLVQEVPSLENGLLSEDGTGVTLVLKEGLLWNDGEPVTAEDIKFTVEWVQDPENASTNKTTYDVIQSVDVVDVLTAQVTFTKPNPFWFEPFVTFVTGALYPKHALEGGKEAHDAFVMNPVGTGPYKVESFTPNDQAIFVINEHYREPNKPYFSRVQFKGGGDGVAAARAVIQTGEYDFAWAPQIEPDVYESLLDGDALGAMVPLQPVSFERLFINHADPRTEVNGQISEMNTPHPILSDAAVRQAIALGVDRQLITDRFYGLGSVPGFNVVNGDVSVFSPNTSWSYDPDLAGQSLEDAGWVLNDDGVREKDGATLELVFCSPVNARRQKAQATIKANLEAIGFAIRLEQVDAGIFFDASPGNAQSFNKAPWDLMLYISPQSSTRPISYMEQWYAGPDGENIAQESNGWGGSNNSRWQNADYDAALQTAKTEMDPDALIDLFIEMNDLVVNDNVLVPLAVNAGGHVGAHKLRVHNLVGSPFSGAYWNIANWNRVD